MGKKLTKCALLYGMLMIISNQQPIQKYIDDIKYASLTIQSSNSRRLLYTHSKQVLVDCINFRFHPAYHVVWCDRDPSGNITEHLYEYISCTIRFMVNTMNGACY